MGLESSIGGLRGDGLSWVCRGVWQGESKEVGMDAAQLKRDAEKSRLLKRLAELMVEEQRAAGVFEEVPHYSVLEDAAHGRIAASVC